MGTYRFILAVMVLLSHVSINTFNFYIGVIAVVNFLMISGYLNTYLLETYYQENKNLKMFYFDRLCRILPQYYFYFFLVLFINSFIDIKKDLIFLDIILEFPIILSGYHMLFDNLFGIWFNVKINPPTWSLGLELTFYIIIPFIILFLKKYLKIFLVTSLIFYLLICFFNYRTDTLGYRLIPGTLYIFLIGSYFYYTDFNKSFFLKSLSLILLISIIIIFSYDKYYLARFSNFLALGVFFGLFFLNFLKKKKQNKIDLFLGNLAYGVFLNHFFVIEIFNWYFEINIILKITLVLIISMTLSYFSYTFIEVYASNLRKKIRYSLK